MKTVFVLSIVVPLVATQSFRSRTTEAPICSDYFSSFHDCSYSECLVPQVDDCPMCNTTCIRELDVQCSDIRERCSRGCPLSRDEFGCPVCQCEEPDDSDDRNPCRVNATFFTILGSCHPLCVERRDDDGCFMCNRECNVTGRNQEEGRDQCGVRERDGTERECDEGSICLLEGILNQCIRMPRDGEPCERRHSDQEEEEEDDDDDESDSDFFTRIEGVRDRLRVYTLPFSAESEVPCSNGTYCSEEGECRPIRGPCIDRRASGAQLECDDNGNFEPLQCRRMDDGTHTCRCVYPGNGSMVLNTMRTGIRRREDAPDCEARVFGFCYYQQDGQNYIVHHGETFVYRQNCTRCRCRDGSPTSCRMDSRVNCRVLNPGEAPEDCRRGNTAIEHGTIAIVGRCNLCGCNNGRLTCTDIEECEDEGEEDNEGERRCERCQDAPQRLVCGRDGRTYRSRCFAMNCSGLRDVDVLDGPCSSQPICRLFPCQPGFTCIPLGGRSCLRIDGCEDDERRICVNRTALRCRAFNTVRNGFDIDEDDNTVCGSDRNTYKSFCHLIQMAPPNTRVAHAGRCDRRECTGGEVCGTDGVTYESVCHLQSQSANAQVDYRGACVDEDGSRPWELCHDIRNNRRLCEDTQETCSRRVLSKDGCCPICGGITTLAIDKDALDEYSCVTESIGNLDEFMARMTRDDIIPSDVRLRCNVEVTHIRNSTQTNIEVKMVAKNKRGDADFCHNSSLIFAKTINNATSSTNGGAVVNSTFPVEVSFARAAVAAPLIEDQQGGNGAPSIISFSFIVLLAMGAALLDVLL